jgi:hypothetical protein
MRKLLLMLLLSSISPVFAVCPIDSGESVCALPSFREQVRPIYSETLNNTNVNRPSLNLQPLQREDPINQMRGPNNDLNYNSGCQFGVCLQNPEESKLPSGSGQ